eukprot:CAMPEP_0172538730 /NCGR_PEP_ID=MMETSP1067-20121228/10061_1 /TAXON_ID=265564 ORGANISM="Thalassiosira punctigera, Strain Tpunct2005C2" /NCGR_SAMPLE_ID=MMETSP1067 /ASSEMBLY_ACC=CAM_ASM_000444 /LENGTH=125 /DNA_ID=CAMNT_0013324281 /DNA_START=18 /DNA_END=392 /DNA_ORIENTATION=+
MSKIAAMVLQVVELGNAKAAAEKQVATLESTLEEEQLGAGRKLSEVEDKLEAAVLFNSPLTELIAYLQNVNERSMEESKSKIVAMLEEASTARSHFSDQAIELCKEKTAAEEQLATLESKFDEER